MISEKVLWKRLSPYARALVICINLLYMYQSFTYLLTNVMKHNIDVFSTWVYFWKSYKLNSSIVTLKFLAIHDQFLRKDVKTEIFNFLH